MTIKPIPRGIHSTKRHEPVDHAPPVAQRTGAPGSFDPTYEPQYQPMRDDTPMLQAEIEAILFERYTDSKAARRILKIDRIRRALHLLERYEEEQRQIRAAWRGESSDAR